MNKLAVISTPVKFSISLIGKCKKSAEARTVANAHSSGKKPSCTRARQSGKLHSNLAGHVAFGAAVFVSLMAAATVASHNLPLALGGF